MLLLGPYVAFSVNRFLPFPLENVLFFLPQIVFPAGWTKAGQNTWWFIPIWGAVVLAFGWFSRGRRGPLVWLTAAAVIVLTTIALHLLMPMLGMRFELDGP